ncbi:MAG TPA: PHP domain-containing protein, partial [Solirubrobacteraceae bacterium]|nr:PHP domain-containing protein [Solirubrobacteraceae bacterium]
MTPPDFDLQSHSTRSDGELEPAAVVAAAAAAGVRLLALTDHDTVDGVDEALAAAAAHGIELAPAVEVSTIDGEHGDLHVLGYRIDHREGTLLAALERSRAARDGRAARMADALRRAGLEVDETELDERRATGLSIGRPHLAEAVLAEPANAARLAAEGLADVGAVIEAYL